MSAGESLKCELYPSIKILFKRFTIQMELFEFLNRKTGCRKWENDLSRNFGITECIFKFV